MRPRILVVSGEEGLREIISSQLEAGGYEVASCADGGEVAAALAAGPVDVSFVDISLADKSGIDVLATQDERLPLCPVILIAGAPTSGSASEAWRRGAFAPLVRPVSQDSLLGACRIALGHKALIEGREACRANLEAIFKGLRDLVVVVDDRMRVVEANRQGLCGLEAGHMVGRPLEKFARCANPGCVSVLRETLRTGRPTDRDGVECLREGGASQVVGLATSPLLGEGGAVTGAVLVVRDQTRLAALERQLKARQGSAGGTRTPTAPDLPQEPCGAAPRGRRLEDLPVRERIRGALARAGGNRTEAAKLLGWSRRTLYRKLAEHGIAGGGHEPAA